MEQWVGYASQDDDLGVGGDARNDFSGTNTASDSEIHFKGSTTLDNGLQFGVNVQLEGNTSGDQIDESYLFVTGSFGRVEVGSENTAQYKMQYSAPDVGIGLNSGDQTAWVSYAGVGGTAGTFRGAFGSTFVEVARANDARTVPMIRLRGVWAPTSASVASRLVAPSPRTWMTRRLVT